MSIMYNVLLLFPLKTNNLFKSTYCGRCFFLWGDFMSENLILTIIEFGASLIVEGIILSMIFNWIASKETQKQEENLQKEMNNIETQNKFIYDQLQQEIQNAKTEIISQTKESAASKKGGS